MLISSSYTKPLAILLLVSPGLPISAAEPVLVKSQPRNAKYPEKAAAQGVEGIVLVSVRLDRHGVPSMAAATEGPRPLRMNAEIYVMKCRFDIERIRNFDPSSLYLVRVKFMLADRKTKIDEAT